MARFILVRSFLSAFLLLPLSAVARRPLPAGAKFSYSLPQTLTLHEPVCLDSTILNEGPVQARVDLGEGRKGAYLLEVTQPNGVRIRLRQSIREGISMLGAVAIEPGQSFRQTLVLNEWYGFDTHGHYQIQIRITEPVISGSESSPVFDPGFKADLEIQPRNTDRLETTLNELTRRIDNSRSYTDAAEAATAMRYVADPLAVPHLEEALHAGKMIEPIAIAGLEGIANQAAVSVLISSLESNAADVPVLARAAMQRIQQNTHDSALKERIGLALQETVHTEKK